MCHRNPALLTMKLLLDLAQQGHTILLSSHILELVENWCQEIIILNEGKILAEYTQKQIEEGQKLSKEFYHNIINKNK